MEFSKESLVGLAKKRLGHYAILNIFLSDHQVPVGLKASGLELI